MEMVNREYLLLSPASNNSVDALFDTLLLGDEVSGVTPCNAVSLKGTRGKQAIIGRRSRLRVPLPEVSKAVLLYDELGENEKWTLYPCNPAGEEALKIFVCSGIKGSGPVGIRTSWDWNHTFWGTELDKVPGCWIVPCSELKEGHLEYKIVSGFDENLKWEPSPYENKSVMLNNKTQLISGSWASNTVISHDITLYDRSQHLTVSFLPSPSTGSILEDNPGSLIVYPGKDITIKNEDFTDVRPRWQRRSSHSLMKSPQQSVDTMSRDMPLSPDSLPSAQESTPLALEGMPSAPDSATSATDSTSSLHSSGSKKLPPGLQMSAGDHFSAQKHKIDKTLGRNGSFTKTLSRFFSLRKLLKKVRDTEGSRIGDIMSRDTPSTPDSQPSALESMPLGQVSTLSALEGMLSTLDSTTLAPDSTSSLHSSGSKTLPPGLQMAAGDHFSGPKHEIDKTLSKNASFTKTLSRFFSLKKGMIKVRDTGNSHKEDSHGIKGILVYSSYISTTKPLRRTNSYRKHSTV